MPGGSQGPAYSAHIPRPVARPSPNCCDTCRLKLSACTCLTSAPDCLAIAGAGLRFAPGSSTGRSYVGVFREHTSREVSPMKVMALPCAGAMSASLALAPQSARLASRPPRRQRDARRPQGANPANQRRRAESSARARQMLAALAQTHLPCACRGSRQMPRLRRGRVATGVRLSRAFSVRGAHRRDGSAARVVNSSRLGHPS